MSRTNGQTDGGTDGRTESEPALGEGEQGPRPGPRACGGPAGHRSARGTAPHHAKTPRGGASARGTAYGSISGVRLAHFGSAQSLLLLLLTELAEHGFNTSDIEAKATTRSKHVRTQVWCASTFVGAESTCFLYTVRVLQLQSLTRRYSLVML